MDQLYQLWLEAKRAEFYKVADVIRDEFEKRYGLTIFAEGDMPIEGVTVRRMSWADYENKYGDPEVGEIMATQDSKVKHTYPGTPKMGYFGS